MTAGDEHESGQDNAHAAVNGAHPRPLDELDDDQLITSWGLLSEAFVVISARLSAGLDAAGHLSLPQFDVLIRLLREPGHSLPIARIGTDLGLTATSFAKLLNRLELDGLITTGTTHHDTGVIHATITDTGLTLTRAALAHHIHDLRRHLLDPLGHNGLRALDTLTRTVRDHNSRAHV